MAIRVLSQVETGQSHGSAIEVGMLGDPPGSAVGG